MTKTVKFIDQTYTFNAANQWTGSDDAIVAVLNSKTQVLQDEYSPAHGDPRAYVFYSILNVFPLFEKGVDDEELVKPGKGVVY